MTLFDLDDERRLVAPENLRGTVQYSLFVSLHVDLESVLQATALQIRLELILHVLRQRPAGLARSEQRGVVLLDELVHQRGLGPMLRIPGWVDEWPSAAHRRPLARQAGASLRLTVCRDYVAAKGRHRRDCRQRGGIRIPEHVTF